MTPRKHKIFFWLVLAAYSTFFAEVFAGSDMFPFFNIWGILVIVPIYGLHIILLTSIIFKYGNPTLSTLVFAGMLFGLYEAYMTKVLWKPDWGASLVIGEVAVVEMIVLVFWWHTWFSFITPLVLGERLLTNSHHVLNGLTGKLHRFYSDWKGYLLLIVFGGIFQSINSPSVEMSMLSGVSTGGVLILLTLIWKRITREENYSLPDLLPNRKEFCFLSIWLGALYLFLGMTMFPERIPGVFGQSIIIIFYIVIISLFRRALYISQSFTPHKTVSPETPPKYWLLIWAVFILTLFFAKIALNEFAGAIILSGWAIGGSVGIVLFIKAWKKLKKPETESMVISYE